MTTCAAPAPVFPDSGTALPPRRQGFSIVTHAKNLKGRELLKDNIDKWIREVLEKVKPAEPAPREHRREDELPFQIHRALFASTEPDVGSDWVKRPVVPQNARNIGIADLGYSGNRV